jgi:cytochrome c-type biogenesis protein CcmH
MKRLIAIFVMLVCIGPALALEPGEQLKDPALETRARALSAQLRCLVCQNQSIDDSDAPLAKDLRMLIREHLVKGESDAEVMEFVVDRYGEFVLLNPRLGIRTIALWAAPFTVLLIAALALFLRRAPAKLEREEPLTEAERQSLQKALE